ncbi:MAG: hypothetical protein WC476_11675 [Phycisphaerae bacterium]
MKFLRKLSIAILLGCLWALIFPAIIGGWVHFYEENYWERMVVMYSCCPGTESFTVREMK